MYDPPFVQTVNIPQTRRRRLSARRGDAEGRPEADPVEDVVMVNTPEYMEEIDVHLVELPTTVLRDGKPVQRSRARTRSRCSTRGSR